MYERLFPRWGAALFALLPLSEILYAPVNSQTVYAAFLACIFCAILCAVVARWGKAWQSHFVLRLVLALAALWALVQSVSRMARFLQATTFQRRSLWGLMALLLLCSLTVSYMTGLIRCAMWALPVVWMTGVILLISCALTICNGATEMPIIPVKSVWRQCGMFLRTLLPAGLVLSLSLPEKMTGAICRGWLIGGGLLALLSLRTFMLLGTNTTALLPYPNFSAAGLAALGDFARHGEVFFSMPLLLCEVGRAAALGCICLYLYRQPQTIRPVP